MYIRLYTEPVKTGDSENTAEVLNAISWILV